VKKKDKEKEKKKKKEKEKEKEKKEKKSTPEPKPKKPKKSEGAESGLARMERDLMTFKWASPNSGYVTIRLFSIF